jgi:death-on-curing protein
MSEPVWPPLALVLDIHAEQLSIFGGATGARDQGALEFALDRPRNKWANGMMDMAELAVAYAFGLSRNHPFVDGNKRMAFAGMLVFMGLNGVEFVASEEDATAMMLAFAAGEVSEESLARWIRDRSPA